MGKRKDGTQFEDVRGFLPDPLETESRKKGHELDEKTSEGDKNSKKLRVKSRAARPTRRILRRCPKKEKKN